MAIFAYVLIADSAMAASPATGTLPVTATVANSCTVTGTTAVAFGAYDPLNAADNIAGAGDFTFRCIKGTLFTMHITRNNIMVNGANNLLYTIYSDSARTVAWASAAAAAPNDSAGNPVVSPSVSNVAKTMGIFGKIAALQDVATGNYSETITVSVNY